MQVTSADFACFADGYGRERPDREWLLHPFDVWLRNPHYVGEPGPHPEDEPDAPYDYSEPGARREDDDDDIPY